MLSFLTFIGILVAPIFTFGCVLIYFEHPILGVVAIIGSFLQRH